MQSGSKKLNKGSTLDVLRCTHSQTRRAATRRLIFLHKKPGASLSKDAVCKGMLLSFSMLAIQFPSDKFETRDITAAACISQLAKVISSLQSNNQYDAGRTWKFSLIYFVSRVGEIIGALMVAHIKSAFFRQLHRAHDEQARKGERLIT
jgi:hypothetical protein